MGMKLRAKNTVFPVMVDREVNKIEMNTKMLATKEKLKVVNIIRCGR